MKVDSENKHISDEVLARYLSGKATAEEETAVLDYLSENDERVEDLLAMSAAIETCSTGVEESKSQKVEESKGRRVGIALWHNSASNGVNIDPAPAYAEQDSIVDSLRLVHFVHSRCFGSA